MPKKNHPTFGDIQSHIYLTGTVKAVYRANETPDENKWDTADVEIDGKTYPYVPIRYHCTPTALNRANGSVADGARGFIVGDRVILLAKIKTSRVGIQDEFDAMYVMGHVEGIKPCTYNFIIVRTSLEELVPIEPPMGVLTPKLGGGYEYTATNPGTHEKEWATVFDVNTKTLATAYKPTDGTPYSFPCTVEELKPFLDTMESYGEEMFTLIPQGDNEIQYASAQPVWTEDFQGNAIRGATRPRDWWTTYNPNGNPVISFFSDSIFGLMTDTEAVAAGRFTKTMGVLDKYRPSIDTWKARSPSAFCEDYREYLIQGGAPPETLTEEIRALIEQYEKQIAYYEDLLMVVAQQIYIYRGLLEEEEGKPEPNPELILNYQRQLQSFEGQEDYYNALLNQAKEQRDYLLNNQQNPWPNAIATDGLTPLKATSRHLQSGFGEDEIWICGKNTFMGIVVSYCDAAWKFVRAEVLPPVIPIENPAMQRLASGLPFMGGSVGMGSALGDLMIAIAADITQGDENNIFSWGTLKRINEGCFHRTSHGAIAQHGLMGSNVALQLPVPRESTPRGITAINLRLEKIDIWYRYDNWMNTLQYSSATYGVNRAWWFRSYGMQWRVGAYYIDTPIGSMYYEAPKWEVALWSEYELSNLANTARSDTPTRTDFIRETKHSNRVACQVYVVQRQAVSLWRDPSNNLIIQRVNSGPFDCHPNPVEWVQYEGVWVRWNTLPPEQQATLYDDRTYRRTPLPGETIPASNPLEGMRTEIEIMAAADLYGTLQEAFGRKDPRDQERCAALEKAIADTVAAVYADVPVKELRDLRIEARIS